VDHHTLLDDIRRDNRSGATALLRRAAAVLQRVVDGLPNSDPGWQTALTDVARGVASVRPPFAGLVTLASAALDAADAAGDARDARQRVSSAISTFGATLESDAARCVEQSRQMLAGLPTPARPGAVPNERPITILTISASSLVERAILAAASAMPLAVVCLESRPACEGVALATRLATAGCTVTLAIDAAGPALVADVDAVLLGCDTLAPPGLVHKIGTFGVALVAQRRGVPVYVLAGSEKLLPSIARGALADGGPPSELLTTKQPRLAVVNHYFDLTPLDLLAGVILPDGLYGPADVSHRAAAVTVHPSLADLLER
jgi:translation initiation factor 2B subunit (eIF-2B alpha/beta/delta family)